MLHYVGVTSATVTLMRDGNQIVALLGPDLQAESYSLQTNNKFR